MVASTVTKTTFLCAGCVGGNRSITCCDIDIVPSDDDIDTVQNINLLCISLSYTYYHSYQTYTSYSPQEGTPISATYSYYNRNYNYCPIGETLYSTSPLEEEFINVVYNYSHYCEYSPALSVQGNASAKVIYGLYQVAPDDSTSALGTAMTIAVIIAFICFVGAWAFACKKFRLYECNDDSTSNSPTYKYETKYVTETTQRETRENPVRDNRNVWNDPSSMVWNGAM